MNLKSYSKSLYFLVLAGFLAVNLLLSACSPIFAVEAQDQPAQPQATGSVEEVQPTPTRIVEAEEAQSQVTDTPVGPGFLTYANEDYRLAFDYPPEWTLTVSSPGEVGLDGNSAPVVIELLEGDYHLLCQINFHWIPFSIGGGLPPGDVNSDGKVVLLGQDITRNRLVYEGRTKIIWYGGSFSDLDLYFRLEDASSQPYEQVDIPEDTILQAEDILVSFTRTGDPFTPPNKPTEEPRPDGDSAGIEVDGWIGTIISASQWPQIDDYFQLSGKAGGYGITSLDGAVKGQLESYRDSGMQVRIWGRLYEGRMDAFDLQIEVDRIEVYLAAPADDGSWIGVVVSNPPQAQFDDYFQMMDQNGTRCGIDSLDPATRQQIESLRDSGQIIQVWGRMLQDVPDAYSCQLQITHLEMA